MPFRYLLLNKPYNVLSQFTAGSTAPADGRTRHTLADFVPVAGVYPAGRLDFDSEGLLLLTDDGELQHCVSEPRFAHSRTYWVQVEGEMTDRALKMLCAGVTVQDYRTKPCEARLLPEPQLWEREPPVRYRKSIPTSWVELTLSEGRNRQVRRMTAVVGFPTLRLVRVRLGELKIEGLTPGQWRMLTPAETAELKVNVRSGNVRRNAPVAGANR
jgi:23S rRNA pseudouridine2457 synthase